MARDITSNDTEFIADLKKFSAAATPAPATYGVTAAELTQLGVQTAALEAAQNAEDAAQTAYRAAVKETAAKRAPVEALFRNLRADAYDTADDAQLLQAGLEPHKKPSKTAPTPPQDLRVVGGADGVNALQWEAGENPEGTQYVLYERDSPTENWRMFDVVTTLRAKQNGQVVGKTKYYQVAARRRGITSEPSNVAVAFGNA
jgi:hypothetical protein